MIQRRFNVFSKQLSRESARLEFAPSDDRSSKNEPKRVERTEIRVQGWECLAFPAQAQRRPERARPRDARRLWRGGRLFRARIGRLRGGASPTAAPHCGPRDGRAVGPRATRFTSGRSASSSASSRTAGRPSRPRTQGARGPHRQRRPGRPQARLGDGRRRHPRAPQQARPAARRRDAEKVPGFGPAIWKASVITSPPPSPRTRATSTGSTTRQAPRRRRPRPTAAAARPRADFGCHWNERTPLSLVPAGLTGGRGRPRGGRSRGGRSAWTSRRASGAPGRRPGGRGRRRR